MIRTRGDQLKQLADTFGIESQTEKLARLAKVAVRTCQADIATRHDWKYLISRAQINLVAPYSTGSVAYTAATRTLTLSGGTFPTWAPQGVILMNRNVYAVDSRTDGTHLVLSAGRCPADDVAAGTEYSLAQTNYDLPADYVELLQLVELERLWPVSYLPPDELLARTQIWFQPATVFFYTILGGSNGRMQLQWSPPPNDARTFDILYQSKPRPFTLPSAYSTGKTETTAGSAIVNLTSAVLPQDIAGCIFRVGTTSVRPDGPDGDNPAVEEHVILSRVSDTSLQLRDNAVFTGSGLNYEIDDPIDIEPTSMLTLYDAMCEARVLQRHQSPPDRVAFAARQERDALVKAIEADARIIPKCLSGSTLTSNIYNLLYGVTPHGVP